MWEIAREARARSRNAGKQHLSIKLTFVGCGDAFGSGGRFNTCFHVETPETRFLIDCGASSLIAMKKFGIDRSLIDTILITHFHGDHFGGLPYFMLDAQFSKRTRPLVIAGPPGVEDRIARAMEIAFPGSSRSMPKFELTFREIDPAAEMAFEGLNLTSARVVHGPPEQICLAFRIHTGGKVLAYSGDTEWCDALVKIGRDADLFIAEAYYRDKQVPFHMDLATLESHLLAIRPKRLILTHMSDDMLGKLDACPHRTAADGMVVEV